MALDVLQVSVGCLVKDHYSTSVLRVLIFDLMDPHCRHDPVLDHLAALRSSRVLEVQLHESLTGRHRASCSFPGQVDLCRIDVVTSVYLISARSLAVADHAPALVMPLGHALSMQRELGLCLSYRIDCWTLAACLLLATTDQALRVFRVEPYSSQEIVLVWVEAEHLLGHLTVICSCHQTVRELRPGWVGDCSAACSMRMSSDQCCLLPDA